MNDQLDTALNKSDNPQNAKEIPAWLKRFVEWGSDRVNPLLVRNIRQNLRNRVFLVAFFLMLGVGGLASIMLAASPDAGSSSSRTGYSLFVVLAWVWGAGVIVMQSISTYKSVITERQDDTWDLIDLTTLEPRHILRGLLFTALVQGIMFTAALAPFMVMAYMLRGLNMWVIIIAFILVPATSVSACILNIFCASLTNKKSSKALLGLIATGGTIAGYCTSLVFISGQHEINRFIDHFLRWDSEVVVALFCMFNAWVLFNAMFLIFSSSMLKHKAANRSTGPRSIWMLSYLNIVIIFLLVPLFVNEKYDPELFLALAIIGCIATICLGLFSTTEHNRLSPRQARDINRENAFVKFLMHFIGPGAARGRIAFIYMSLLTMFFAALAYGMSDYSSSYRQRWMESTFTGIWVCLSSAAFLFVLCDFLYRGLLKKYFDTPALRRSFILTSFAIINIIPAVLITTNEDFMWITPIAVMVHVIDTPSKAIGWQIFFIMLGVFSYVKLAIDANKHYRPDTRRVVAEEGDRNPRGE